MKTGFSTPLIPPIKEGVSKHFGDQKLENEGKEVI
jgi:hypothetical protein